MQMDALMAFIGEAQKPVTGRANLQLYKGNIIVDSRFSPNSLYDEGIATMEGGGSYKPDRREGFCGSKACPTGTGRLRKRKY